MRRFGHRLLVMSVTTILIDVFGCVTALAECIERPRPPIRVASEICGVLAYQGLILPDTPVTATSESEPQRIYVATADARGRFRFAGVRPGRYSLSTTFGPAMPLLIVSPAAPPVCTRRILLDVPGGWTECRTPIQVIKPWTTMPGPDPRTAPVR